MGKWIKQCAIKSRRKEKIGKHATSIDLCVRKHTKKQLGRSAHTSKPQVTHLPEETANKKLTLRGKMKNREY